MSVNKADTLSNFLPINRRLFANKFWTEDRVYSKAEAWIDLIQTARFEVSQGKMLIGMKMILWNRGELVASVRYLSLRWKWSLGKVMRFLDLLEDEKMITRRQEFGQTIISLLNYSVYNGGKVTTVHLTDSGSQSSEEQRNTQKEPTERKSVHLTDSGSQSSEEQRYTNGHKAGTPMDTPMDTKLIKSNKEEEVVSGINAITHTDEQLVMYKAFTEWIKKNAVNVSKMKEPFTIEQYLQLRKKIPDRQKVQDLLLKMHNWTPLLKKNNSAYLTILNWSRNDYNNQPRQKNQVVI